MRPRWISKLFSVRQYGKRWPNLLGQRHRQSDPKHKGAIYLHRLQPEAVLCIDHRRDAGRTAGDQSVWEIELQHYALRRKANLRTSTRSLSGLV